MPFAVANEYIRTGVRVLFVTRRGNSIVVRRENFVDIMGLENSRIGCLPFSDAVVEVSLFVVGIGLPTVYQRARGEYSSEAGRLRPLDASGFGFTSFAGYVEMTEPETSSFILVSAFRMLRCLSYFYSKRLR